MGLTCVHEVSGCTSQSYVYRSGDYSTNLNVALYDFKNKLPSNPLTSFPLSTSHHPSQPQSLCKMEDLLMMCMATVMVLITVMLCKSWKKKRTRGRTRRSQLPRGSLGWPLIGETLEFMSCAYSPCPERFMDKRQMMYGKVFKSHIFGSPTIVSTDAEVNRFILQSDASIFVPSYPKSLTELMGKSSILSINGSLQRRVHGLIGAFLKSPSLKAQITLDMHKYLKASMACWKDDQLIYIQDETKHVS